MLQVQNAAILAGGKSARMGRDKALLPFGNQTLIGHIAQILSPIFAQTIVVTTDPAIARAAALPPVADTFSGHGPLSGIHAALAHFEAPTFVVACDMPFLNADFIRFLAADFAGSARVPLSEGGFEPLHAVYAPACLPNFEAHLQIEFRMPPLRLILRGVGADWIEAAIARRFDADLRMFANWNSPADVE